MNAQLYWHVYNVHVPSWWACFSSLLPAWPGRTCILWASSFHIQSLPWWPLEYHTGTSSGWLGSWSDYPPSGRKSRLGHMGTLSPSPWRFSQSLCSSATGGDRRQSSLGSVWGRCRAVGSWCPARGCRGGQGQWGHRSLSPWNRRMWCSSRLGWRRCKGGSWQWKQRDLLWIKCTMVVHVDQCIMYMCMHNIMYRIAGKFGGN